MERRYNKDEVVVFSKTTMPFGGLSNMAAKYSVFVNEIEIPFIENLYQACRYPLYPKIQEEILSQTNPVAAKKCSRKNIEYTRKDWEKVKYKIMYWCLQVKLIQNWDTFSELIKETQDKPIVEYSTRGDEWGASPEGNEFVGINAQGRLLMALRRDYILNERKPEYIIPPRIPGFLLYGHMIGRIYPAEYYFEDAK